VCGGLGFAVFGSLGLLMPDPTASVLFLTIAFVTAYLPTVSVYSAISEVVPGAMRARFTGISTLMLGLITNSFGPFLVGFLSDHVFHGVTGIRWAMIATTLLAGLSGAILTGFGVEAFRTRIAAGSDEAILGGTVRGSMQSVEPIKAS
jgi:MFS family permease